MSSFTTLPVAATVNQSVLLTFTGTGTAWTAATLFKPSAGTLSNISVDVATQTATALFAAPPTAQAVTFSDGAGSTSASEVAVTAGTFSVSPAVATINQSQTITLTGNGSQWTAVTKFTASAGTISNVVINVGAQTATLTFVAPATAQAVTLYDSNAAVSNNTVAVTAGSFTISPASVKVGSSTTLTFTGTGTQWVAGTMFVPSLGVVTGVVVTSATSATGTFAAPATAQIVTFADSNAALGTNQLTVSAGSFTVSPTTAAPNQSQTITLAGTGTAWTSATVFAPSAGTLSGVIITSAIAATGTFTARNTPGASITFTDNLGAASTNGISIPAMGPTGSFLVSPITADTDSSVFVTFTGTGTTWDGSSLFTASIGEMVDQTVLSGTSATAYYATPTSAQTVTFAVASNGGTGANGSSYNALVVGSTSGSAASPSITSAPTASAILTVQFAYQITATNSPISYAATGLPSGLTLNTSTGIISGVAARPGVYSVTLTASSASAAGAPFTLTLTVAAGTALSAPVITSPATANGTVGAAFSYQITAGNSPTSFSMTGSVAGVLLNGATGLLSGAPTTAGIFSLVLTATNAAGGGTLALAVTISVAIGVLPGAQPSAPTGFLNGSAPGAPVGVVPVPIGSINGNAAVRLPGASLTINDFGLDVSEPSWRCRTAVAATLKPDLYDAHPYLPNLFCVGSTSTEDEGLTSVIRATYKGLVKGVVRPWEPSMSENTDPQTLTFNNGTTTDGGPGILESSSQNTITFANIPVPQFVYGLRGASKALPDISVVGVFFANPPGCPTPPATFTYPAYGQALLNGPLILFATLVFVPNPRGWMCDRLEFTQAGYCWEVTQQWKLGYQLSNYIYPTDSGQKGSFTVYPTTVAAGQSIPVAFTGVNTNWTTDTEFFANGGTISNLAVNTAQQIASGTFTAPPYPTVVTVGASGIDSTNSISVTAS